MFELSAKSVKFIAKKRKTGQAQKMRNLKLSVTNFYCLSALVYSFKLLFTLQMPPPEYSTVFQCKLEEISALRRELQVEYRKEYEAALVDVKDALRETEGPELTEKMKDEIREWFNKEK